MNLIIQAILVKFLANFIIKKAREAAADTKTTFDDEAVDILERILKEMGYAN